MLSGNGRHRRPRQAPALLVAAGVTGSAIALPLLGAASANAADGSTWDHVAECESGGSWSADNGTGYYGGLQISLEDWSKYGGLDYASTPDQASRSQQIAVAEKMLADQGTKAWRTCALLAGLSSDDASVNVDTGLGDSSGSSGSSDSSDSSAGLSDSSSSSGSSGSSGSDSSSDAMDSGSDSATPSPGASVGGDSKTDPSGKSSTTDKSESADSDSDSGSGASKASESPVVSGADHSDKSWQTGGSWSLVDTGALSGGGKHRGGSADENVTNGQAAASSGRHASGGGGTYTVRDGDTLASIADSLDLDGGWRALYDANKADIGSDANAITPGQTLKLGTE